MIFERSMKSDIKDERVIWNSKTRWRLKSLIRIPPPKGIVENDIERLILGRKVVIIT